MKTTLRIVESWESHDPKVVNCYKQSWHKHHPEKQKVQPHKAAVV